MLRAQCVCALGLSLGASLRRKTGRAQLKAGAADTTGPSVVGKQIMVDGKPFFMQGVAYSPIPIGESAAYDFPYGDYFLDEYQTLWERDFPLLVDMGVNTLRLYGWTPGRDHGKFLDACQNNGLRVILTFYMGHNAVFPVNTPAQQQEIIDNFAKEVVRTGAHPAIFAWTLGNEINGAWNGFIAALDELNGCEGDLTCSLEALFDFIDKGSRQAREALTADLTKSGVPKAEQHVPLMVTSLADVNDEAGVLATIAEQKGKTFDNIDVWGIQLYRGSTFGGWLEQAAEWSTKPALVTEYGVDAMSDPCGTAAFADAGACNTTTVANMQEWGAEYGVNELKHAEWNANLTSALYEYKDRPESPICGGSMMAWVDERWKSAMFTEAVCSDEGNGREGVNCSRFHSDCPANSAWDLSLCGYPLEATFDNFINEAWFGINEPSINEPDGERLPDSLKQRKLYYDLRELWTGKPTS